MSKLYVKIDYGKQIAVFYGPGTFMAREEIKALGEAFWRGERKAWEVHSFTHSVETLKTQFPDLSIEELIYGEVDGGAQAIDSPVPKPEKPKLELAKSDSAKRDIPQGSSVAEFSNRLKQVISAAFPQPIYIFGVLSKVSRARGAVFLELSDTADPGKRINCVIWSDEQRLCKGLHEAGFKLEADLQVMLQVRVNLNQKDARISCVVTSIVAEYTIAKIAALRETTNKKLIAEGIFEQNKRHTLPFLPMRLGILTSASGTVINDFMASLTQGNFGFELFWFHINVQGANAKRSIVKGLETLAAYPELDAILLFRGGGSPAELSVFSEYEVAKAVCLCPLPVISAIGHQEDQSSVQDVSYLSFGVPKDIGRHLADVALDIRSRLHDSALHIEAEANRVISEKRSRMFDLSQSIVSLATLVQAARIQMLSQLRSAIPRLSAMTLGRSSERAMDVTKPVVALGKSALSNRRRQLEVVARSAAQLAENIFQRRMQQLSSRAEITYRNLTRVQELSELRLSSIEQRLNEAKPEVQLKRGFTLVTAADGSYLTSREAVKKDQQVAIQFHDGVAQATVSK